MEVKTNSDYIKKDNLKKIHPTGVLVLEDGSFFKGYGFGFEGITTGEVCFNTSITGYQEIITDPSYAGQIINFTFPHIGNVGTNKDDNESEKIWVRGLIFNTDITTPSNYRSIKHLDSWLKKNKIVGITGIDTRKLTNYIRDNGAPKGTLQFSKRKKYNLENLKKLNDKWSGLLGLDLASQVSCKKPYKWNSLKTWNKEQGYKKNKINYKNLKYFYNKDYENNNILNSIFCGEKAINGNVIIAYSDILFESSVVRRLLDSDHDISVVVDIDWRGYYVGRKEHPISEAENVIFNSNNEVIKIGKIATEKQEVHGEFIGMMKLTHSGAEIFKQNFHRVKKLYWNKPFQRAKIFQQAYLTDMIQELVDIGVEVHCVIIERGWKEIDTAGDYQKALQEFKQ